MCGIALIISGVKIDLSSSLPDSSSSAPDVEVEHSLLSIDDLKAALLRRGPDGLGSQKVFLHFRSSCSVEKEESLSLLNGEEGNKREKSYNGFSVTKSVAELHFIGATLQLRGITPIFQPLVDTYGNILVYNGEIFGGIHVGSDSNDAETLIHALGRCCSCDSHGHTRACFCIEKTHTSVPELLSTIKGPWSLIYWQDSSKTMWFGRDAFGRRSLLVHWPTLEDSRLLLSSVSPPSSVENNSDRMSNLTFWEELSCGIYSISINASKANGCLVGEFRKHDWTNTVLKELIKWERTFVEPKSEHVKPHSDIPDSLMNNVIQSNSSLTYRGLLPSVSLPAHKVLIALRESVMRRTILNTIFQTATCEIRQQEHVPVAVLFSGGLDSMILAALLNECLDSSYQVDLLNVSFDSQSAPDRISAKAGVKELQRIAPSRRWKLVEIDADLSNLTLESKHVMSLINPAKTYMDLNIGIALWMAAGGDGWVEEGICDNNEENNRRCKYKSEAKILLVGSGADEQCAGYGRHRTKYRLGSWLGLHEEMKLDMHRIWKRNLGRDDRCISDNGKEARFPFLDEDVIRTLLEIPLWEVADLDQPVGRGDKKILRDVARLLGLEAAAVLSKRAIQFGSRIARESNRKNFGSNRAANQASAGSVEIYMPTSLT
ncbi:hypothetical protein HHK36_029921 [Tetracentron sinense]|uniref:Asparagine synthetase domain-containing protein n=1 Tax=Tetracentron sinense TaxID=13715 RepID=A0A834YAH8_TETSI|nr:hypothetical protein HHK36_029921 [Tetracentron sinense]